MNRQYEGVFILDNALEDTEIDSALARLESLITSAGGKLDSTDKWGRRRLAYEIRKRKEGFYALMNFELPALEVRELDRKLRLDEHFLRFLIIVKEKR